MNTTTTTDDTGVATHFEISSVREAFKKARLQQRCQIAAALLESERSLLGVTKIVGGHIGFVCKLARISKLHPRLFQFLETKNPKEKMLQSSAVLLAKFDHDTQLKIWATVQDIELGWQKERAINKIIDRKSKEEPIDLSTSEVRDAIPLKPRITYVREAEKPAEKPLEKPEMDKATAFLKKKEKEQKPQEIYRGFTVRDFSTTRDYEFAN